MVLGMLGIMSAIYSFPNEYECARHLFRPFIGASLIYIPLGLFIYTLCQLHEKLIKHMHMDMKGNMLQLSEKDKRYLRYIGFYRITGICVIVVGALAILMGIHGIVFDCEQVRSVNIANTWFAFSLIPLGWLIVYISKQLKRSYNSYTKAINEPFSSPKP